MHTRTKGTNTKGTNSKSDNFHLCRTFIGKSVFSDVHAPSQLGTIEK